MNNYNYYYKFWVLGPGAEVYCFEGGKDSSQCFVVVIGIKTKNIKVKIIHTQIIKN